MTKKVENDSENKCNIKKNKKQKNKKRIVNDWNTQNRKRQAKEDLKTKIVLHGR